MDFLFLICNVGWAHTKGILGDIEYLYSISLYLCDFQHWYTLCTTSKVVCILHHI